MIVVAPRGPNNQPQTAVPGASQPRGSHRSVEVAREIPLVHGADRAVATASTDVVPRERSELAARALNLVVAAVALVLLAPLMLLIAAAIKLTSSGPVLYRQTRVGLDRRWRRPGIGHTRRGVDMGGRLFTMYKFRTMCVDAEACGREVWAAPRDARVTLIGRVLRRTRLDELPQFWNVLCGDMNIVGPRPERPTIFAQLRDDVPGYALRQRVKPGITGWAQVNQSYDTCVDDVRRKVHFDIEYIQQQSLGTDLRIMTRTLPVMLFGRGGW